MTDELAVTAHGWQPGNLHILDSRYEHLTVEAFNVDTHVLHVRHFHRLRRNAT